jgi:hypothetical protein
MDFLQAHALYAAVWQAEIPQQSVMFPGMLVK